MKARVFIHNEHPLFAAHQSVPSKLLLCFGPAATLCSLAINPITKDNNPGAVPRIPKSLHQTWPEAAQLKCAVAKGHEQKLQLMEGNIPSLIQNKGGWGGLF